MKDYALNCSICSQIARWNWPQSPRTSDTWTCGKLSLLVEDTPAISFRNHCSWDRFGGTKQIRMSWSIMKHYVASKRNLWVFLPTPPNVPRTT